MRTGAGRARWAGRKGRAGSAGLAGAAIVAAMAASLLAQQPPQTPLQRLEASILRTTRSINATWGIYVKALESGEEIAVDADRQMETMSTIKIPLMIEAFEQIKAGKFKLTDKYTFVEKDSEPGTGTIQRLDYGAVMTVKDLITMMIIVSDNTATEVLFRMVGGPDAVNARMQALGLKTTRAMNVPSKWFPALRSAPTTEQFYRDGKFPFGYSSPREMGRLLEMMERGTLVDKPSSDLMLRIMRGQLYRTRIPRYVTGYTIPHKTGDFLPYVGDDVGMLEAPGRTIILSVFTGNHFGSGEMLENAIGLVARDVAEYFAYRP
jgi:beta-lactamase class A